MKQTILAISLLSLSLAVSAQERQQDRGNSSMLTFQSVSTRREIILPEVNGYKVIKTDLHCHTVYSDGSMTPSYRMTEAWQDGLDAIAMTDHIEYRPNEKVMKAFLSEGVKEVKGKNDEVQSDMNLSVNNSQSRANQLGLTLIPGIEITRDPVNIGHFNALFTTDNNLIPDPDPLQAVRNAKKQGAIVQNNHPGWRRSDNDFTEVTKAAIREGLIDGVEVINSPEFYPDVIETAVKDGFYVCSGSDIHSGSYDDYIQYGFFRNMTLVLAKDASLSSIREGLENKRTLAYGYGDIAGSEELLKDFFLASVDFSTVYTDLKGTRSVKVTNKSSFPYTLTVPGRSVDVVVRGLSSIIVKVTTDVLPITVMNMWYGAGKHPSLEVPVSR